MKITTKIKRIQDKMSVSYNNAREIVQNRFGTNSKQFASFYNYMMNDVTKTDLYFNANKNYFFKSVS